LLHPGGPEEEKMTKAVLTGLVLLGLAAAGVAYQYPTYSPQLVAGAQTPPADQPSAAPKGGKADKSSGEPAGKDGKRGGGDVPVEAANAETAKSSTDLRGIGSLQSDESVQIASEVAGRIKEIPLKEGQPVKEGDVLVKLDEALAEAEVADANARFAFAKANQERAQTLARQGNMSERLRDEANANAETTLAAVELSKTRLAKHTIRAPFSGTMGLRSVSPGAFIAIGQPMVNIEKIDTLKVDFKLPELYLEQIKTGQKLEVTVDALPGRTFDGEIYAINPHVDVNGRSLGIRARLPNTDGVLRPGLFARILVKGLTERQVVVVPESAVVPRGGENFIYAIEGGKAVESKVTLGNRKAGIVEVLDGLKDNATVVTAGQQRLRNGAQVEIIVRKSDVAPADGG
jgi:membrane fusion protein (multidrug efflux system)